MAKRPAAKKATKNIEAAGASAQAGNSSVEAGYAAGAAIDPDATTISVAGPRHGRRRAGRRFGPDRVDLAIADLTDEEIEAIATDPVLDVLFR